MSPSSELEFGKLHRHSLFAPGVNDDYIDFAYTFKYIPIAHLTIPAISSYDLYSAKPTNLQDLESLAITTKRSQNTQHQNHTSTRNLNTMGQTRVRKTKKATDETTAVHRKAKLSEVQKLKLEDSPSSPTFLTPPGSAIDTPSGSSLFSKPSSESLKSSTDLDTTTYIEVKNTETKGQAIFATRKIQPGTLILSETPLIRLTQAQEDSDKENSSKTETEHPSLESVFSSLPRPVQKSYLTLYDSKKSSFTKVASIYYSNCYNLTSKSSNSSHLTSNSPGGSCIGQTASRINHSCIPNVQFSYSETQNLMLFHAIKPIPRGKEILSTYDSVYEDRAHRQRKQLMYYGFKCECEACEPRNEFWTRSDERRRAMAGARKRIKEWERRIERSNDSEGTGEEDKFEDLIEVMEKLEGLLIKEGLVGLPLADCYGSMAKWTARKGRRTLTKEYQKKEYNICRTCLGEQSPRVVLLQEKLED